ncbi:hypothetical protein ACFCVS_17130 [Bacillus altitudinis]|uniref:hypothetical protein n=1 Tax=Bacillus altitudinis TaxID=293387 RepID=UPI0035E1F29C
MRYQINQPNSDVQKWSIVDVEDLGDLIKKFPFNEGMVRTSISSIESNNELKVLNLGAFRIDIENSAEIEPTLKILKKSLRTRTDKI